MVNQSIMVHFVIKNIKGHEYLYLVHSVRIGDKVVQKTIKYIGPKRHISRDEFLCMKDSYENNTLFIDIIPVIPPVQRDAYQDEKGMWVIDPLNDYYVTIIRRAYQVESTVKSGPLFFTNLEDARGIDNDEIIIPHII